MEAPDVPMKEGSESLPKESLSNVQTPPSEGAPAVSRKRSSPVDDKEDVATEPKTKRRRVEDRGLPSPPPEDVITAVLDGRPSFDDEPSRLLRRAIALMLEHIGFAGATKEALEELCGEFDSCKLTMQYRRNLCDFRLITLRCNQIPLVRNGVHAFCTKVTTYTSRFRIRSTP